MSGSASQSRASCSHRMCPVITARPGSATPVICDGREVTPGLDSPLVMGYTTSDRMSEQPEFEVRELAHLVNTNSRRGEGGGGEGVFTPAIGGRGGGGSRGFVFLKVHHP